MPAPVPEVIATVERRVGSTGPAFVAFADERYGWAAVDRDLLVTADGGATWEIVRSFDQRISALDLVSSSTGWVATEEGLFRTTDGGKSWERLTPGSLPTDDGGNTWEKLPGPCGTTPSFVDANTGWQLCATGGGAGIETKQLHRTDDGGRTWRLVADTGPLGGPPGNMPLSSYGSGFFFLDKQHGWLGDAKGGLLVTHDGGASWERLPSTLDTVRNLQFFSPERGIAVLTQPVQQIHTLVATSDGGRTWRVVYPLTPHRPQEAKLVAGKFWVAVGTVADPGAVLMRQEGERDWRRVGTVDVSEPFKYVTSFSFIDAQTGWVAIERSDGTRIYHTTDGAATWAELSFHPRTGLHFLDFTDPQTGYAGEYNGVLWVTHDGGRTFERLLVNGLQAVRFLSASEGWAIERQSVSRTTDGGAHWKPISLPGRPFALDVLPGGIALVATDVGLYWTRDGGATWTLYRIPNVPVRAVKLVGSDHAVFWDDRSALFETTDGGKTWR